MTEMTKVFLQCTEKWWAAMQGYLKRPASDGLAGERWIKLTVHLASHSGITKLEHTSTRAPGVLCNNSS